MTYVFVLVLLLSNGVVAAKRFDDGDACNVAKYSALKEANVKDATCTVLEFPS